MKDNEDYWSKNSLISWISMKYDSRRIVCLFIYTTPLNFCLSSLLCIRLSCVFISCTFVRWYCRGNNMLILLSFSQKYCFNRRLIYDSLAVIPFNHESFSHRSRLNLEIWFVQYTSFCVCLSLKLASSWLIFFLALQKTIRAFMREFFLCTYVE